MAFIEKSVVLCLVAMAAAASVAWSKVITVGDETLGVTLEEELFDSSVFELTSPVRTDNNIERRDLRMYDEEKDEPVEEATFSLRAFNREFPLKVKLKRDHYSSDLKLRSFENGKEIIRKATPRSCHYAGTVEGMADSSVAMSTCQRGLRAVVRAGRHSFYLEPHESADDGTHKVYPLSDTSKTDDVRMKRTVYKDPGQPINEYYQQFLTTNETRYNELYIVVDSYLFKDFGSDKDNAMDRVLYLVNNVDEMYKIINIRVVLVGLEIWSDGDKFEREHHHGKEYGRFGEYKAKHINPIIQHDNAHFFSSYGWPGIGGLAGVGSMCGSGSRAIVSWSKGTEYVGPVVAFAHEMGHNFRMGHDSKYPVCYCPTTEGCIQGGQKHRYPLFSDCNMKDLAKLSDFCLYNVPSTSVESKCGNGIKEEGEECDSGEEEDKCCDALTCKLKASSQCSDRHHSCCNDCLFKAAGALCRGASTQCDVPEYCTGDSGDCPADNVKQDGQECSTAASEFAVDSNIAWSSMELSPRLPARFLRFVRQGSSGLPTCAQLSFTTCQEGWDDASVPTSVLLNGLCLRPKSGGCSAAEGSPLVYAASTEGACSDQDMQFFYDKNTQVLKHACTGMHVCPRNGSNKSGTSIVLSNSCTDAQSKWTRMSTPGFRYAASQKKRCLWQKKTQPGQEIKLHFYCPSVKLPGKDCDTPVSDVDKMLCTSDETVTIEFDKEITLSKMKAQTKTKWKKGQAEFLVQTSDDGVSWSTYTSQKDEMSSSSYCYEGRCADSRDMQCKDLWGQAASSGKQVCYDSLNTCMDCWDKAYGTCDGASAKACKKEDATCGQLQCSSSSSKPVVDYAESYKKIVLQGETCSAAALSLKSDEVGSGMVEEGTKCGDRKMCKDNKCQSFDDLGIKACPLVDGKECAGRGVCNQDGVCSCQSGYDPQSHCSTALQAVNGKWSPWSKWTACDKACGGGKKMRYRFCNKPAPANGGLFCSGSRVKVTNCNTKACPEVRSCRHLQAVGAEQGITFPDGVYTINPGGKGPIKTICDMTHNGGGWTLVVSSRTNKWTESEIRLRSEDSPSLNSDYSILSRADDIKNAGCQTADTFEYRLEAQHRGRWGGIWSAPCKYSFVSTSPSQRDVTLVEKFDDWTYAPLTSRMPYIVQTFLTTNTWNTRKKTLNTGGTIINTNMKYKPAPWIMVGHLEKKPAHIWYWVREAE